MPDWRWPLDEVRRALAAGDTFYIDDHPTGDRAEIEVASCGVDGCAVQTLRLTVVSNDPGLCQLPVCECDQDRASMDP